MSCWVDFVYREFYDVPRIICLTGEGTLRLLLDCKFDPVLDDYPDVYTVHLVPENVDMGGSWAALPEDSFVYLGTVPVSVVVFDPTKRKQIDVDSLRKILGPSVMAPMDR